LKKSCSLRHNLLYLCAIAFIASTSTARAEYLKLGNEGVYPPFSMVDPNGHLIGVEPDLAREMCRRMNAECEFMVMEFKALIPSLIQGKFDILVSQTVPLPERKERALFSMPLLFNPDTFVVPADSNFQFSKDGLKGVRVGLQRGGAQTKWLLEQFGDVSLPQAERGRSWLVRKGEDALLARVNVALASMMEDCTFTRIRKKYISFSLQPADAACDNK
jgi:arginine/ornithine transport system substrate-binding protein